ncbi:MAG: lipid-A-disaccharide synthase [Bacteroidetes bacterium]|nr:lipid-A-disaccharide synthase [Bacteroidota bacterium]
MKYYIIAGEASGDLHASNLMKELKKLDPGAEFRVWGGDLMAKEGGDLVRHYRDLAFMGFLEVLVHLRTIMGNIRFCKKDILAYQPDVLILVDYPGFNLRIARFAHDAGINVFYYISPQLWAWRSSRVKTIKKNVDRMFVILPFEKKFYEGFGYDVDFIGHPLLDVINEDEALPDRKSFLDKNQLPDRPLIALLPGSRKQEIKVMLETMLKVAPAFSDYHFVIAAAPSIAPDFYSGITQGHQVSIVTGQTYELLHHSAAALVTSGTATLETALMGIPQVVCYKGSQLSYLLARQIVRVKYISLVNLVMDREVIKELIQEKLTTENLETELKKILSGSRRREILESYALLWEKLGGRGASAKAAQLMIQYLKKN